MKKRGRKPIIDIKMQIDLFKKYHEELQKSNLRYNNPIFTTMSKEIDAKMSPKALHMSYLRNYVNRAYSEPKKLGDTSSLTSPSTNNSTPIADKGWRDWKSLVNAKYQKTKTYNEAVRTYMPNNAVTRPCRQTSLSELKERLLNCLDIEVVQLKNNNNRDIDEAVLTNINRVSIAQQRIMFTFMKANEDFGKGQIKGPNIEKKINNYSKQLTELLNQMGPAIKSPDRWLKYWQDWKLHIKEKWNKINHYNQTKDIMHGYSPVPRQLTPLEEKVVQFCSLDTMDNGHGVESCQNKINMVSNGDNQLQRDDFDVADSIRPLPEQFQNVSAPETSEAGPSKSTETGIIEDVIQAGSIIKMELDSSDSEDPLNFEAEEEQISSESHSPKPNSPEPDSPESESEPEIEQPATPPTNLPRRKRIKRVIRRPITRSRLDSINRMTVNELKKALTQKNEIKKQFYAEYMVEVRKQTEALVAIAKKLTDR